MRVVQLQRVSGDSIEAHNNTSTMFICKHLIYNITLTERMYVHMYACKFVWVHVAQSKRTAAIQHQQVQEKNRTTNN